MTQKIALVTGASKGIGRAIAIALAKEGFTIWLNYRADHDAAHAVQAAIQEHGATCTLLPFDVCDAQAAARYLDPLLEEQTPFVLVNNAGFTRDNVFGLMSEEDWTSVLNVHLNGFFTVTRKVAPRMQRARKGRIINITSTSGQTGVAGQANYCAAKAGLIGVTRSLARELARRNVLVNAVAPGFIATEMTAHLPVEEYIKVIPQGRVGTAEEVAHAVVFLSSDMASYITGQVIAVNGGLYM